MMNDKAHSEIRKIAYSLWVEDGRPDGQDRRHWDKAKEIWAYQHSGEDDAPSQPVRQPQKARPSGRGAAVRQRA